MKNIALSAAAFALLAFGGCTGETSTSSDSNNATGALGTAEARLTLPEGFSINSVHYQVTGNGVSRDGDINVTNSSVLKFRVGNLPLSASNYTLTLTADTTDVPPVQCAGSVDFPVSSTDVTAITMTLTCGTGVSYETDDKGDISVTVSVENGAGVTCPVVTGITALPLETAVGSDLQLEGYTTSAGDSVAWTGEGGTFAAAGANATAYTCTSGGIHTLSFTSAKAGCDDSVYTVDVECTGAVVPPADAGNDSGTVVTPDAGTDAGPSDPFATCQSCLVNKCSNYSGLDVASPCFENNTTNTITGATFAQPETSVACTAAVSCSIQAPSNCASDLVGPARCYCGTDIDTCLQSGPVATAECIPEWEAATGCAAGDYNCVTGAFQDATTAAGFAFFTIACANQDGDLGCKTECAL